MSQLFQAIEEKKLELIVELLSEGHDPNVTEDSGEGWTPLQHAVEDLGDGGSVAIVHALLKFGANVNKWNKSHTTNPILIASNECNLEAMRILLGVGADPNVSDAKRDTPLRMSVYDGMYDMVELLLKYGAAKTINDWGGDFGLTALGIAASQLDAKMIRILIDAGANLDVQDDEYKIAKQHIPRRSDGNRTEWEEVMRLLWNKE
jgi:cytohesin